jgi:polyisoprenoid-binding protein YceI
LPDTVVWEIDPEHSNVCFTIHHLGIAEVMGFFRKFNGSMESASDDFSDAKIQFNIDVNSIESNNESRNMHLKSNGFFYADQFPEMKFKSKSFKKQKGNNYKLSGELTIRDVTKNVTFDVEYLGAVTVTGVRKVAFKAEATINRFEFNIKWNTTTPDGIQIIDDRVNILLNLELSKEI